jgi:hypothetical protein
MEETAAAVVPQQQQRERVMAQGQPLRPPALRA